MTKTDLTSRRRAAGFTLIELMVTVSIVAILTAIAYPSYRNYVIRGQLVDATNGLSALRANMERYFQDNRTYLATPGFSPPCIPATPPLLSGKFTLTCPVALLTATSYQLQAQGTTAGTALYGFVFTVDQDGNQATTVSAPAPAAFASCSTAWVTKTGGC